MEDRWEIYLRIIVLVGRAGRPLREVEDELVRVFGISVSMARYYMRKMKERGWIRYSRPYKTSKQIWVEPRRKLINYIMDLKEQYGI